jgi:phosphate transport system substrate-binding protein
VIGTGQMRVKGRRVVKCSLVLLCLGAWLPQLGRAYEAGGEALRASEPAQEVNDAIRIWGSPADSALLADWTEGFRRLHPQTRIQATLYGPESTMAGVYNGVAELAFMAREMRLPVEAMAFTWVYRYQPFSVEIANAGLAADRPSANLAVVVNRANPLEHLTLDQLDGILGTEHRRGGTNLRSWGDLGLRGAWGRKPIHVYGPPVDSIAAIFIRSVVLRDSYKWNPAYREISGDDDEVLRAVAHDPQGIAYARLGDSSDRIKPLALAATAGVGYYALTARNVAERTYPLGRAITMMLNRKPGEPIEFKVKEFLQFILSPEGQAAIARDGHYIPLTPAIARVQVERLE